MKTKNINNENQSEYVHFDDLARTTKTVMVYTNIEVDLPTLFYNIPVYEVNNVPLTKKKKRPDIKKVRAPYLSIISIRDCATLEHRGIITKPERFEIHKLREKERKGTITEEELEKLKKINIEQKSLDFRNQLCCYISLTKNNTSPILNINLMIFKDSFKIVGCKQDEYAHNITKRLWHHLYTVNKKTPLYKKLDNDPPTFLFDFVMNNLSFYLGYQIHRKKLNALLNKVEFNEKIEKSHFDPSGNTNINVTMYSETPSDFSHLAYRFTGDVDTLKQIRIKTNIYKERKKKGRGKPPKITFLVFRSSKVIFTGRYLTEMEDAYHYFLDIAKKNRSTFEEC